MRQDFHPKLVIMLQRNLWCLPNPDSRGSSSDDNCACWQGGALGQEADEFRYGEDQVTKSIMISISICTSNRKKANDLLGCALLEHFLVLESTKSEF